jgi:hypothetical protein
MLHILRGVTVSESRTCSIVPSEIVAQDNMCVQRKRSPLHPAQGKAVNEPQSMTKPGI